MKLRGIDLSTYIAQTKDVDGAPLFVVNNTPQKGRLLFSCVGEAGIPTTVKVLDTWVPLDLTTQAQRSKLIESTAFKDLLRKNALKIVAAEVEEAYAQRGFIGAEEALTQPDVKDEYERVMSLLGTVSHTIASSSDEDVVDLNKERSGGRVSSEQVASDIALSLIAREEADEEEQTIINAFRTKMSVFTIDDLIYISSKSKIAKIKELAAGMINDLKEDDESAVTV